ncbi:hypothetical protein BHE74_00042575 [Ensete ventricosum]|nr:hypothetical protein BHE74_00042575 [Ensete ventricosum]
MCNGGRATKKQWLATLSPTDAWLGAAAGCIGGGDGGCAWKIAWLGSNDRGGRWCELEAGFPKACYSCGGSGWWHGWEAVAEEEDGAVRGRVVEGLLRLAEGQRQRVIEEGSDNPSQGATRTPCECWGESLLSMKGGHRWEGAGNRGCAIAVVAGTLVSPTRGGQRREGVGDRGHVVAVCEVAAEIESS